MEYTKIKIFGNGDILEIISTVLIDRNIKSIELEVPETYQDFLNKKNSYDWDYVDSSLEGLGTIPPSLTFYLEDSLDGIDLLDEILEEIRAFDIEKVEISNSNDEDWKHRWKEYFKPIKITDKIVIKPTWDYYEKNPEELVIEIDPGMAFGTGTHPTTTLCIKLLEKYINETRSTVLDIGCGSGILTIAASMLGAGEVIGVDIDPQAIEVAKKNIKTNSLSGNTQILEGDLAKGLDFKADILVANLMADLVIMLSQHAPKHLNPGGIFISSGILIDKKEEVVSAIISNGFEILSVPEEGEWCAIAAALLK